MPSARARASTLAFALAVALAFVATSAPGGAFAAGPFAPVAERLRRPSDPITFWSVVASTTTAGAGMSPLRQPLTLALVHLAMHDAVAATTHAFAPFVLDATSPAIGDHASTEAAVIEAAYTVLVAEVPSARGPLQEARRDALARLGGVDRRRLERGKETGQRVAEALLAQRAKDGRNVDRPFVPGAGAGQWTPTPPAYLPAAGAFLATVQPFVLPHASAARPPGPPALTSARYARELQEVRRLGARTSTVRTPAQTANALFWEPLAGSVWPVSIHRVAEEQRLDVVRAARFQAAAFVAFADAMIACWEAKIAYASWRPVTAIVGAASDGNAATAPDPDWEPLGVTPNFPEYPSGHASISAAVAEVIEGFFEASFEGSVEGSVAGPVAIPATNVRTGEERRYTSAKAIADEVVEARMLLGVHFRAANEDGVRVGQQVARAVRHRLLGAGLTPASSASASASASSLPPPP